MQSIFKELFSSCFILFKHMYAYVAAFNACKYFDILFN